ncbi:MAG: hypothetical protein CVV64_13810 [Candidatus Wallbacteria bacterium HGW-Wallbacteria-1]|uniref:histidine kinase n=1 Tax=Candidatus Wallbacteria bacterium HGW-Wallbacteria-1 TaxID=2013854 RepID=A0A2N1PMB7_9BACT|nr:MAG: hypothetical protein CVV64_13810 [Candidatus Wallbacteria bacterium HGW-Wallbacteria-1]
MVDSNWDIDNLAILRRFFDDAPVGIFVADSNGQYLKVNRACTLLTGYSSNELLEMTIPDLIPSEFLDQATEHFQQVRENGHAQGEFQFKGKDGTLIWVMINAVRFESDFLVGYCQDLTLLRSSQDKYRLLFESLHEASALHEIICDENGRPVDYRFIEVNPAFEKITGLVREDVIGKTVMEVLPGTEMKWVEIYGKVALTGVPTTIEEYSGELDKYFEVTAYSPEKGNFAVVFRDVTKRVKNNQIELERERQIQQHQRLESIGLLAGGVAHDFNNLLMTILGHADLAGSNLSMNHPAKTALDHIVTAATRASDLCRQLLAYSGRGKQASENIHLSNLVNEMICLFRISVPAWQVIETNLARNLPLFIADPIQIRQIVMNLITNASEAMTDPDRSRFIINTGHCQDIEPIIVPDEQGWFRSSINEPLIESKMDKSSGWVFVEVSDNGCGMGPDVLNKAFDPFFSTKFAGRGLGLAAVAGIIKSHKGWLEAASCSGRGTIFKIWFPASGQNKIACGCADSENSEMGLCSCRVINKMSQENQGSDISASDKDTGKNDMGNDKLSMKGLAIMVDDEEPIRELGSRMLERLGFKCLAASNGQEALELLEEYGDSVSCMIMDILMPVKNGEDTFCEARKRGYDQPVLMISGYCGEERPGFIVGDPRSSFLAKPFTLKQLRIALTDLMV